MAVFLFPVNRPFGLTVYFLMNPDRAFYGRVIKSYNQKPVTKIKVMRV
jgi:hypothetical protein